MGVYIFQRIVAAILTVWLILTLAFVAIRLIPGDPVLVYLGDYATPELIAQTKQDWGLDKPILAQYVLYLKRVVQGDFGHSLRMGGMPVGSILVGQYPYTLRLVILSMAVSLLLALPLGMLAAVKQNSFLDLAVMTGTFFFLSMPTFWFGLLLLVVFSVQFGLFPTMGTEEGLSFFSYVKYLTLPVVCLGLHGTAMITRMVRSSVLEILHQDYVRTARSKGARESTLLWKHVLRNALCPIISLVGVNLVILLGGVVVIEVVFSRGGLGYLYVEAVSSRDYPMIQGCVFLIAFVVVTMNLLVDLSYAIIDPRIRYTK